MKALKFRIILDHTEETEVFRDILIDPMQNFETLHEAIIKAFNFRGDQMASFYFSNDAWDKGQEVALMDMGYGDEDAPMMMGTTPVSEIFSQSTDKLLYVYDFFKMWIFYVQFQGEVQYDGNLPHMHLSLGIAPDEDSKEMDFSQGFESEFIGGSSNDMKDEIDDIFNEYNEDDLDGPTFENIDDFENL